MRRLALSSLLAPWIVLLYSLCFPGSVNAGSGDIQDGKLNLLVYFAYEENDPASWIPVFDEYSKLMLNATEGGLQLGTVQFTRCPDLQNEADVWILNDFSGARAHLSGLGRVGMHITISQTHKSISGGVLGHFGLLHESGHYLWGCYDEYLGYIGNLRQRSSLHFCSLDLSNVSCIMDGGSTVTPNNLRTEFCTDTSLNFTDSRHNQGIAGIHPGNGGSALVVTDQEYFLGRSCWQQLSLSGVGTLPNQLTIPSQVQPLHEAVVYDQSRLNGDLALSLVIDVSGSMSAEGRLTQAILGGQAGVGLLRAEESLSIVVFSDTPSVLFGQQSMGTSAKQAANSVLSNLVAGGGTAAGLAVLSALGELNRVNGCVEFIVLITDGVSAAPNLSDPSVTSALAAGGQAVYSVAIGSFPDVAALSAIAVSTGGAFYSIADVSQIPGVLADIFASAGSGTPVSILSAAQVPPAGSLALPFSVAARDSLLRLSLSHAPGAVIELSLTAPDGSVISADQPPAGVQVFRGPGSLSVSVSAPLPGAWSASLQDPMDSRSSIDLLVFVEGAELDVNTLADSALLHYPDPMQLSVSLVAGVPVGKAQVNANVRRPDGSVVPCSFYDDGLAVHGDERSGDGVYSTLFARYVGDGAYRFDILIDASLPVAVSNEECGIFGRPGGEDGQESFAIDAFQACANHTLLLTGQSVFPMDGGALSLAPHPRFLPLEAIRVRLDPATPVAAFELQVSAAEPLILQSLLLDFPRTGVRPELADGMALHLDRDADGQLDVPSVPLAIGKLTSDAQQIEFKQPGAALHWLAAGSAQHFLLTLGEGPQPSALASPPGTGSLGLPAGGAPGFVRWLLAGAALAFLLRALWLLRRGERLIRPLSLGLLLLCCIPACSSGSSGGSAKPGGSSGQQKLLLGADGIQAAGAVSGLPSQALGADLSFELDILGP